MRRIEILEDVHVRFPGRGAEFDLGVEIGALTALMAIGDPIIERTVSPDAVEQLRPLAERFGYTVIAVPQEQSCLVHLASGAHKRPSLRLISSL